MPSTIQRRTITKALLDAAATQGKPIGDGEMPRGGAAGWQGDPNADGSNFVPYAVVSALQAGGGTGPLLDPQGDMIFPYAMTSYGVSREQCEWLADNVRQAVAALAGQNVDQWLGTSQHHQRRIQQVVDSQIGAINRVDQTDPPIYSQTDVVALWTSR